MIGILALQGDFPSHEASLGRAGRATRRVVRPRDLEGVDALVLPGGESTTMLKLLAREGLDRALRERIAGACPVLATCAGMILLAARVTGPEQPSLGLLDVHVERNGYGRQVHSGVHALAGEAGFPDCTGIFIRAPRVHAVGEQVQVLARRDRDPVLVRQGNILAASFHPELCDEIHPLTSLFLDSL